MNNKSDCEIRKAQIENEDKKQHRIEEIYRSASCIRDSRLAPKWNFGFARKCPKCNSSLKKEYLFKDGYTVGVFICPEKECGYIYGYIL
ncbi:MAG: hypothetical protein WC623_21950 [Pedobacter sp.]|uniref:hypothetical protein n=1 Tax=Pedobacter sp. TaxID=1411316 RepID=UPI003564E9CA